MPPSVSEALRRAAGAVRRCAWLAPVGLVVALARTALVLPAQLFAAAALQPATSAFAARRALPLPLAPAAVAERLIGAVLSPRFLCLAAGLWLAGLLLSFGLRVAYLAGALPTLGRELAGARPEPAFATGFSHGFARLLPSALVALALELLGSLAGSAALAGAVLVALASPVHPAVAAALAAGAGAGAIFLSVTASSLGDATLARAAIRGEGAPRALARASLRFARRPAAFLCVAMAAALTNAVLAGSAQGLAAVAGAAAAHPLVALGPQLMAAALAACVTALVELWRLSAAAVLACHAGPGVD